MFLKDFSLMPSLNTQSCIRRPLCCTLKFKDLRGHKKKIFHVFWVKSFFLILYKKYQATFYCIRYVVFKKIFKFIFAPQNIKKDCPQKLLMIGQTAQKQKSWPQKAPKRRTGYLNWANTMFLVSYWWIQKRIRNAACINW